MHYHSKSDKRSLVATAVEETFIFGGFKCNLVFSEGRWVLPVKQYLDKSLFKNNGHIFEHVEPCASDIKR